jgi:hypothetical protein
MKSKVICAILLTVLAAGYCFGQTAGYFEKKYNAARYYEIRPYTLVSPRFDKNGRICQAEIIPYTQTRLRRENPDSTDFIEVPVSFDTVAYHSADKERLFPIVVLNSTALKEVFDELVPLKTRKGRASSSVDMSGLGLGYTTELKFENVTIGARVVLTIEKAKIDMRGFAENPDLFFNPPFGRISSAWIAWTERNCPEN